MSDESDERDERLIRQLARAARERAARGERWDKYGPLVSGTLSAEQEQELERAAVADPQEAMAREAFRPLDNEFRRRLASRLRREQEQGLQQLENARKRRRWRVLAPAGLALAAAAAILLLVLKPFAPSLPALPDYGLRLRSGDAVLRGNAPSARSLPRISAGSTFLLELRPDRPLEGPVTARFHLQRQGGAMEPLTSLPLQVDPHTGAMRVEGELGQQVRLPPGELTLWVSIGRPGALPVPSPGVVPGRQPGGAHLLRVSFQVDR